MRTCPRGHPHTPENRYVSITKTGKRNTSCRICTKEREQRKRAEMKALMQKPMKRPPPPPAAQPVKACAISPDELAIERERSRERRAVRGEELRRIRMPENYAEFAFGVGSSRAWEDVA